MTFAYGCARDQYAARRHPRVLCDAADLARLKRDIRTGIGKKIMTALRRRTQPVIDRINQSSDLAKLLRLNAVGLYASFYYTATLSLNNMAMMAALDDDGEAMRAVRRVLCELPAAGGPDLIGEGWLAFDLLYDRFTFTERRDLVRRAKANAHSGLKSVEHRFHKSAGGNITMFHGISPLLLLLTIQGEPGAGPVTRQYDTLIDYLKATLHVTINRNGFPEEDTGYGTCCAAWLSIPVEAARRAGLYDAWHDCPRLAQVARATLAVLQPWGEHLSITGDHPPTYDYRDFLLPRTASEANDPTALWQLGKLRDFGRGFAEYHLEQILREVNIGKGLAVPATCWSLLTLDDLKRPARSPKQAKIPTQYCDPQRGIVTFRSGWSDQDTYVQFDGSHRSPAAQGHAHASAGHFSITVLGDYFSIDTSRYCNEQDQHSLTLINGKSGRTTHGKWTALIEAGVLTGYHPEDFVDSASVDSSHQHDTEWARRWLGFVKGRQAQPYVWTVDDINHHDAWAEFWWQLQTSPGNVIRIKANSATITGWRCGNHMDVHMVLPTSTRYPKPHRLKFAQDIQTVSAHEYVVDAKRKARAYRQPGDMLKGIVYARPRLLAKVGGYNARFMALMLPRDKSSKPARVKTLPTLPNALAAQVTFDKVRDTIIFAYEHQQLEAGDLKACGQWAVVRQSLATGRVLDYQLHQGTSLTVAGKKLV